MIAAKAFCDLALLPTIAKTRQKQGAKAKRRFRENALCFGHFSSAVDI
jgi:hypothetical protein